MITKLTAEQERGITEWQEHCLKIGRDTSHINKKKTEESWIKFYKILGKNKPLFWYCQSPMQAQIIINIFPIIQKILKKSDIGDNIGDNISVNIWANIWANIGADKHILTYVWCQHDIGWIGYFKCYEKYGLLPHDNNMAIIDTWYDLACSCGWCYTFENMVFVCEKPSKIYLDDSGRLHGDNCMALEYSDGYGLWMLHGIRVPQWLVETPSERINPELALQETNADVQREIIRKIGAERMLKHCNAQVLDSFEDPHTNYTYKLMTMDIGPNIRRKYLYFEHASLKGVFYAKPVPPETQKAWQARGWMLSMIERSELGGTITKQKERELIANLPKFVS